MKDFREKRGQMRVIETIVASFIIVAALSFFTIFATNSPSPSYEMTDLEKTGYSALHDLYQQGLLTSLVSSSENWTGLRMVLKMTMPNEVYFNLTIQDLNGNIINHDFPILYGDSKVFTDAKNVASVTYCLAVPGSHPLSSGVSYSPAVLVLELTRG